MSRETFEAWARPLWRHREDFDQLIGAAPGTYNNYEVQAAWVAWQESAKQEREALSALARDAERYLWLRDNAEPADWEMLGYQDAVMIDHEIDAAILARNPEKPSGLSERVMTVFAQMQAVSHGRSRKG